MRTAARWALPTAVATAVVGGSVLVPSVASATPDLAPTTAAGLLTDVASAHPRAFSGTVSQTSDLGLPQIPTSGGSGDPASLTALLAGTTTAKVWSDGAQRSRIAVVGKLAETDVVRNGSDVWTWRSGSGTVAHSVLPSGHESAGTAATPQLTPAQAAEKALAAVDPTTKVALGGTATVAGRAARLLVLEPRDAASLVGRVVLAVDAETSTPLQVQVFARGATDPALSTGFTSVSFTAPSASEVAPALPKGSTVRDVAPRSGHRGAPATAPTAPAATSARPVVLGSGWTSVAVLPAGAARAGGASGAQLAKVLEQASQPVSGAFGTGRLLTSSLVSVLVLDDGRVLAGAVAGDVLEQAALAPAAQS
jgi:hypothetical protein